MRLIDKNESGKQAKDGTRGSTRGSLGLWEEGGGDGNCQNGGQGLPGVSAIGYEEWM